MSVGLGVGMGPHGGMICGARLGPLGGDVGGGCDVCSSSISMMAGCRDGGGSLGGSISWASTWMRNVTAYDRPHSQSWRWVTDFSAERIAWSKNGYGQCDHKRYDLDTTGYG